MEVNNAIIVVVVLIAGFVGGYFFAPQYIHLEESERNSLENQVNAQIDYCNAREAEWQEFADDCNSYQVTIREEEEAKCALEKAETADRMSEKNYELIQINAGWQDLYEDMNRSVVDLNNTIADLNCWR